MLKVSNIDTYYGNVQALFGVSVEIGDKEIVAVIGSNGAGKSTLMNSIVGALDVRKGKREFNGQDISSLRAHECARLGIVQVPEGREIFPKMTVRENLEMGSYCIKRTKKGMEDKLEEMYDLFPKLRDRQKQLAGTLSGGEQQMVAIARGLMAEPKLLMCDEPSLGLAPIIVDDMFEIFKRVNKEMEIPILLVEQNAFMALEISQRCYILENGRVTGSAESKELMNQDTVKKAYLGG